MAFLNRTQILEHDDTEFEDVVVNEWRPPGQNEDAKVRVRPMTAAQRSRVEATMLEVNQTGRGYEKIGQIALRIVSWCVVDPDTGEPMFTEADVKALGQKSSKPILRIRDAAFKLSGLAEGAVEEAVEDFGETTPNDSDIG